MRVYLQRYLDNDDFKNRPTSNFGPSSKNVSQKREEKNEGVAVQRSEMLEVDSER